MVNGRIYKHFILRIDNDTCVPITRYKWTGDILKILHWVTHMVPTPSRWHMIIISLCVVNISSMLITFVFVETLHHDWVGKNDFKTILLKIHIASSETCAHHLYDTVHHSYCCYVVTTVASPHLAKCRCMTSQLTQPIRQQRLARDCGEKKKRFIKKEAKKWQIIK